MSTTYTIDPLVSGDGLTELNASLTQAQTAINDISSRVDNVNSKQALIRYNVPVDSTVFAGALVYYKLPTTDSGVAAYSAALAATRAIPGDQGESVEADSARVEGMIIAVNSAASTGTLLTGGYWESTSCATACLIPDTASESAKAGTYYLSPVTAGRATRDPGDKLRQPVLSYYGNGKFSLTLFYMAHDNHFHSSAIAANAWMTAAELAALKSITAPTGANWGYNHTADSNFAAIGELDSTTTAIFEDGVLQKQGISNGYLVDQGYMWSKATTAPAAGAVTVFNHYPFAYGSAVIRSVESMSDSLTVVNTNGICRITANDFEDGDTISSALAVAAISGKYLLYTPVVRSIIPGPGIDATGQSDGSVVISSSDLVNTALDAYSINNNGTTVTSDNLFTYLTFPSRRTSQAVISLPIKDVSSGTTMSAVVWAIGTGAGAGFNVKLYYLPTPTAGSPTTKPTMSQPDLTTTLTTTTTTGFAYSESAAAYEEITRDGMLVAVITIASAPSTDIRLLRAGFKLGIVDTGSDDEEEGTVTPTTTNAVTMTGTAGEAIAKYCAVYANSSGLLCKCVNTNSALAGSCLGVALASASAGDSVTYMLTGIIQDANLATALGAAVSPGGALYVGSTGLVSQVDPQTQATAEYSQRIGTALASTILQINMSSAVVIAE